MEKFLSSCVLAKKSKKSGWMNQVWINFQFLNIRFIFTSPVEGKSWENNFYLQARWVILSASAGFIIILLLTVMNCLLSTTHQHTEIAPSSPANHSTSRAQSAKLKCLLNVKNFIFCSWNVGNFTLFDFLAGGNVSVSLLSYVAVSVCCAAASVTLNVSPINSTLRSVSIPPSSSAPVFTLSFPPFLSFLSLNLHLSSLQNHLPAPFSSPPHFPSRSTAASFDIVTFSLFQSPWLSSPLLFSLPCSPLCLNFPPSPFLYFHSPLPASFCFLLILFECLKWFLSTHTHLHTQSSSC